MALISASMAGDQSDSDSWRPSLPSISWSRSTQVVEQLVSADVNVSGSENLTLLTNLIRLIAQRNITEFVLPHSGSTLIGQGATYRVSRAVVTIHLEELWGKDKKYSVAVKVAQVKIPRTAKDIGLSEEERRRLKVVLFETELLSRPVIRNHPNIASLMGFSWDDSLGGYAPCLTMELATMRTAREFASNQELSDEKKLALCLDIVCGLRFLHVCGIVHGDVKQENVLVYADESSQSGFIAKITDFERSPQSTDTLIYTGTSLYNAPETRSSGLNSIKRDSLWLCDVFSFGLLLFEVLSSKTWKSVLEDQQNGLLEPGAPLHNPGETTQIPSIHGNSKETLALVRASISKSWRFSDSLKRICQEISTITLPDDPLQRLPCGWEMVLNFLPRNNRDESMSDEQVNCAFEYDDSYSVLEICSKKDTSSAEDIGGAIYFDLERTAHNPRSGWEQGKAAFNLFLLYSLGRYGPFMGVRDALVFLTRAAETGFLPAFISAKRIFQATGCPVPEIFQSGPPDSQLRQEITHLESLPHDEYYSAMVRCFLPPKLKQQALEQVSRHWIPSSESQLDLLETITHTRDSMSNGEFRHYAQEHYFLHHSIAIGSYKACEMLLLLGCDFNIRMPGGITPLHLACRCAESAIIKLLLSYGADTSLKDDRDISSLHWFILLPKEDMKSIGQSFVECAKGALSVSASCKSQSIFLDEIGLHLFGTPLSWAIKCRNFEAIETMLRLNITPTLQESWPLSYISQAVGIACARSVEYLLDFNQTNQTTSMQDNDKRDLFSDIGVGDGDFTMWLMHGNSYNTAFGEVLDLLLTRFGGPLPFGSSSSAIPDRLSPLCRAVISFKIPLINELLKRGANVNDQCGPHTALGWAFYSADATGPTHKVIETIALLLEHGALCGPHHPPLYDACSFPVQTDVIKMLVSTDPASVHFQRGKETPLLRYLSYDMKLDDLAKVEVLVKAGADINAESRHSAKEFDCCYTPLAYSLANREWPVAEYLLTNGAKPWFGVSGGHKSTVLHVLVQHSFEAQGRKSTPDSLTILEMISSLLMHPSPEVRNLVNMKDWNGVSPLRMAVTCGVPHVARILVKTKFGVERDIVREARDIVNSWTADQELPQWVEETKELLEEAFRRF